MKTKIRLLASRNGYKIYEGSWYYAIVLNKKRYSRSILDIIEGILS